MPMGSNPAGVNAKARRRRRRRNEIGIQLAAERKPAKKTGQAAKKS